MYLRSVIFPAERDRVRQNKMVHVERPACDIIDVFQTADISTAVDQPCFVKDCDGEPAVVDIGAVLRDKSIGASGEIAFCNRFIHQNCLIVVYNSKPVSVKGHRADGCINRQIQIIG